MTYWQDLLSEHSHKYHNDSHIEFGNQPPPAAEATILIPRIDLAVLRASGGDWRKMLQGQTTCDLAELSQNHSIPGALCTPKGRVIANFRLLQDGDDVLLVTQRSTVDPLFDALRKLAPFFKVVLEPTSLPLLATLMHPVSVAEAAEALSDQGNPGVNQVVSWQYGKLVATSERQLLVTLDAPSGESWSKLLSIASLSGTSTAILADIRDGLAWVSGDTSDEFIPQMLALHHTGAVSFKKGCYTGQEVVARMQYLGKLKRQLYRLELHRQVVPAAGTPCYLPDAEQNCGHIVASATTPEGAVEALAVLTDEGAASPSLRLGIEDRKTSVSRLPLPFAEDVA